MSEHDLGRLEFALLASLLEQPRNAYGITLRDRVAERTGKTRSLAAIYAALDRLRKKGMIDDWWGEPTEERGGRRKRFYKIQGAGVDALNEHLRAAQFAVGGPILAGA